MDITALFIYTLLCTFTVMFAMEPNGPCLNRFEYEYSVLQKLVVLEEKVKAQDTLIDKLTKALEDSKEMMAAGVGNSYIHWGKSACPSGAEMIYEGFAAGSHYTHTGGGSNRLCLPKQPMWKLYVDGFQAHGRVYGSEYEVSEFPAWEHLHDDDVPCAVCRIPRSTVVMVPGRYECYGNFTLEYSGYLMSGYHGHSSSLDYVCVDGSPDVLPGGKASKDGALFYFVETACGPLLCPPYQDGRELTCAVCSL